jgi:PAS domain S-box-containing protein
MESGRPHLVDGKYAFGDLVDLDRLRGMFERFSQATGYTTELVSHPEQELLIGTEGRDICASFHRASPTSKASCERTRQAIRSGLTDDDRANIRRCESELVCGATPIVVEGAHLANLISGRVLLEEPSYERFRQQAMEHGHDLDAYLEAIRQVPVVSEAGFVEALAFLSDMAVVLAQQGLAKLRRSEAEKALLKSERSFRSIVESSPMGMHMYQLHDDGRLVFTGANPAASRILGVDNSMFVDKTIEEAFPQLTETEVPQRYREAAAQGITWETEQIDYDEGGIRGAFEVTAFQTSPMRMVALFNEITVRKQAEEAMRSSEERLKILFESAPDAYYLMGLDGVFIDGNRAAEEMLGYDKSELIGRSFAEVDLLPPEELPRAIENLGRSLSGKSTGPDEFDMVRKDGRRVPVEIRSHPVTMQGKTVILGIARDITDRRRAEEEQRELQARLEEAHRMEAVGRLAGGVAHDFNNMLSAVLASAALAGNELPRGGPGSESIQMVIRAAQRAAELTKQLLAFSRKQIIEPRVINLSHLVEHLHTMLARLIGEDVIIEVSAQEDMGSIRADPGQMEQLVLNLALNARDAMPDGGNLRIETADVELDDEYCERHPDATPGAHVMLAVSDSGVGMDEETRARIFEPFFSTKEMGKGTGLGLASVYGIATQHGGRIEVQSTPGEGSCFRVYFPRVLDEPERAAAPAPARPNGGSETVLVVEDEELVRIVAVKVLERAGYVVLAASSGDDALALAARHEGTIDLLLTDVVMPHMDGRELATRLAKKQPGLKTLFTSGYSHNVIADHGVLDEGLQFLAKPYSSESLAARVREVLDDHGNESG